MSEPSYSRDDLSLTGVRRLYERAVEHFDAGEYRQAEQYLEWLIEREPRHGHAYWYLARVKEQKGQQEEALFYWKTCALLNDGKLDWVDGVYGKLADYYTKNRRYQELYDFLTEALRRDGGSKSICRHLAQTAERLGRKAEAVFYLTRCLSMGGDAEFLRDAQDRLLNLCFETGDLDTLRDAGKTLLAADPRSTRAHYLLSRYYEKRGHLSKALLHLRKSLSPGKEKDPAYGEVSLELASLYKKAGKPREALRTLARGALLEERHPFALWLSAECYEEMGDGQRALDAWRSAAEAFGPTSREGREAFFAVIEALIELGREEEARIQLERAPDAIRRSDRARRYLAETYERTGQLTASRGIWEGILAECPVSSRERVTPLLALARILLAEGEAESALARLASEDLESLKDAELFALHAEAHEDLGQEEKALVCWERAEALVRYDRRRAFDMRLSRASLLLKLSRAEDASGILVSMSPRHGQEERYLTLLAQALAEVGDHERALDAWDRLAKSPRPRVRCEGLVQMSKLLRDLGRLEDAVACHERLIAEGHDMRSGLLGLAEIAEERQDFARAHALWDALAEMYESSHALSVRARVRAQRAKDLTRPQAS
ncbi:MAG: tetratricopeptide repeat protein [Acidobacteriota bacterium]